MIAVRSQPLFATRLSKRAIYERNISRCMPGLHTLSVLGRGMWTRREAACSCEHGMYLVPPRSEPQTHPRRHSI